jgi:hypothetical protein
MGEERRAYTTLMGKPEGNRPLGRWGDNIVACFANAGTVEARSIESSTQQYKE